MQSVNEVEKSMFSSLILSTTYDI